MSLSFNSSISGIQAGFNALRASAHNTANINTDGFKKQETTLAEDRNGGVVTKVEKNNEAGLLYQNASGDIVEASNVDLTEEIAEQMKAKYMASANIAVLKTADDVQKNLLDILA